jgi:transcriptional regulator with GAF, ATPase, and Fis domain
LTGLTRTQRAPIPIERAAPLALVVVADGTATEHALPPSGTVVLGRDDCVDVPIRHPTVSRRHAALVIARSVGVRHLGGINGVRVGSRDLSVGETASLRVGEPFQIGTVVAFVTVRGARRRSERVANDATPMQQLMEQAHCLARGAISILICGETGVGKQRMAERIHARSPRRGRPFVQLNCAALPESLLESELFGHERGAFTGATHDKPGLLEAASGGTVFLDEIGELSLPTQAKLLRVLEERRVRRVGAVSPIDVDVRFVAATNRDLLAEVSRGRFRGDLYFRLNGAKLWIPPLRSRRGEIEPLARRFAAAAAEQCGHPPVELPARTIAALCRYAWPGNIRELRNAIERAILLCGDAAIEPEHVICEAPAPASPLADRAPAESTSTDVREEHALPDIATARDQLDRVERARIAAALDRCAGNQTRAAQLLGISRRTLTRRLNAYRMPRPRKPPRSGTGDRGEC